MPPASLSTLEVIRPGPTTARKRARRRRVMRVRRRMLAPRDFQVAAVGSELVSSSVMVRVRQFTGIQQDVLECDAIPRVLRFRLRSRKSRSLRDDIAALLLQIAER